MDQDEKLKNVERVNSIVDKFDEPRRTLVKKMLDGPVGMAFFTAPASSRAEYHSAFEGGLCHHSLNVMKYLFKIADAMTPGIYNRQTLAFAALFHDLGKCGDGTNEMYVVNPSDYGRQRGFLYEINKQCAYAPTSERGLFLLQKYGIEVSFDEWAAIRLNDGQYDDTNKNYKMREPDLALLVHWADRWAASKEKS